MTTDQIFRYIQAPENLNQETLPLLKEMMQQYPAFEAGWILYLKNLKNLNDPAFHQELTNNAIRIHDRRKLFVLLNEKVKDSETVQADNNIYNLIFAPEYQLDAIESAEEPDGEVPGDIRKKSEKKYRLIEKFLEAQPKMPQIKDEEPNSPMQSAKQKQEENDEFVTETLASIFAQQGYYKKAIQIFEKLSLKYPEKSTYFAAQIEKIKNLMNN